MKKPRRKNGFSYCVGGGAGWSVAPPPNKNCDGGGGAEPPSFWSVIAITDVFDITYDIGDFKGHISYPHYKICYLKSTMHQDLLDKCLSMHCLQIAIFTLDTVKITKRFACANKQRAQQTGALPTELTRQWSNLGSGSHGQLFCL